MTVSDHKNKTKMNHMQRIAEDVNFYKFSSWAPREFMFMESGAQQNHQQVNASVA